MSLRLAMLLFASLLLAWPANGAEDEPADLALARSNYEKEVESATRLIRERYVAKLEAMKRAFGGRGEVRAALAVQQELDRAQVPGDEPAELAQARAAYRKDVEFATRPIRDRHVSKLGVMKRSLGGRGEIRAALAVQQELDRVQALGGDPGDVARIAGTWMITYTNGGTNVFVIRPNGAVRTQDPGTPIQLTGKVQWKDSAFVLEFDGKTARPGQTNDRLWALSLAGNALEVNYYAPKSNFPGGPFSLQGKGVKVSDAKP